MLRRLKKHFEAMPKKIKAKKKENKKKYDEDKQEDVKF